MDKQAKKDTVIAASLSLIPYIGGSFAAVFTSIKTDKEIQRLNTFFKDIASNIESFDEKLKQVIKESNHDEEYLVMLTEKVAREVEKEARKIKQTAMKNFFTHSLLNGVTKTSYSEVEFFLDVLIDLSEVDINILVLLQQENRLLAVGEIKSPTYSDPYFILASVNKLRSYGLIQLFSGDVLIGVRDNALSEMIKLSNLGTKFIKFCLN